MRVHHAASAAADAWCGGFFLGRVGSVHAPRWRVPQGAGAVIGHVAPPQGLLHVLPQHINVVGDDAGNVGVASHSRSEVLDDALDGIVFARLRVPIRGCGRADIPQTAGALRVATTHALQLERDQAGFAPRLWWLGWNGQHDFTRGSCLLLFRNSSMAARSHEPWRATGVPCPSSRAAHLAAPASVSPCSRGEFMLPSIPLPATLSWLLLCPCPRTSLLGGAQPWSSLPRPCPTWAGRLRCRSGSDPARGRVGSARRGDRGGSQSGRAPPSVQAGNNLGPWLPRARTSRGGGLPRQRRRLVTRAGTTYECDPTMPRRHGPGFSSAGAANDHMKFLRLRSYEG
mmetsp:Transcript_49465/g.141530  ORF Transcript_49465/g.141530 Transcript_49465/m.141530 type:complete len:342 (+) Transcript_49465:398-1423(+)